jgi:hypothetical protein
VGGGGGGDANTLNHSISIEREEYYGIKYESRFWLKGYRGKLRQRSVTPRSRHITSYAMQLSFFPDKAATRFLRSEITFGELYLR